MKLAMVMGKAGVSLILAACWMSQGCVRNRELPAKNAGSSGAGVPVVTSLVARRDVPLDLLVVGNVEAYLTVTVRAQVSGELTRVSFREGDSVKKGELLFTIDPRQLEAQLNQTRANLARDEAQLGLVEANLVRDQAQEKYAQAESSRYQLLLERSLISKEQAEQMRTSAEAASAAVHADEASIRSGRAAVTASRAAVENLQVQLGYTSIRSPIDGRTGNLNVKQGNIVTANATDLMTINQVQPVYVTFAVPEARLPEVRKGQLVMAVPQSDPGAAEEGELTFVDNAVDMSTGTIKLKGLFRNSGGRLWPGQFVRVTLRLATQPGAMVVPNQAVQTGQDGSYVFVVKQDRTVESRPVVTGVRVGQDLVVEKGLTPGETVVTEGQLRLAPGMRVQVGVPSGGKPKGKPSARAES